MNDYQAFTITKEIQGTDLFYIKFLLDNRFKSLLACTARDLLSDNLDCLLGSISLCINACLREKMINEQSI